ncbi:hypothetical protein BKA62DRAFT_606824, partial [Auriculariales sp. MPI-PUGE-AT-0066]
QEVESMAIANFGTRTEDEHRSKAADYERASISERATLWADHGVRSSPLLRLPYWNPTLWVVADPMHNWLLGVLQAHLSD